ncbi:MAG: hypothetical protein IKN43_00760 [Selenomonadaceae bacterium]|nr:hypothetical protein [Selenomonadaceae bacterium]
MEFLGIESIEECKDESGKSTKIYWESGRVVELKNRAETVLRKIALFYGKTLKSIRAQWKLKMPGETVKDVPLFISRALNFIPVKTPHGKSYVNVAYNADILNGDIRFLRSGRKLICTWTEKTLKKHIRLAMRYAIRDEINRKREDESLNNLDVDWYLKNV